MMKQNLYPWFSLFSVRHLKLVSALWTALVWKEALIKSQKFEDQYIRFEYESKMFLIKWKFNIFRFSLMFAENLI